MSECVVRMNFPKRCYDCDMADGLTCMATGGIYGRDVPKMTWIRGKPEWCPIVCALPEGHGRLIDASEVVGGRFVEYDGEPERWVPVSVDDYLGLNIPVPTIVPAEAEKSET